MTPRLDSHTHNPQNKHDPNARRRTNPNDCLWRHRKRQRYFVKRCLSDFRAMNKTWVLLTDVDEYVVPNGVERDDPDPPLEYAPEDVPTLSDWKGLTYSMTDMQGNAFTDCEWLPEKEEMTLALAYSTNLRLRYFGRPVRIEGTISGLPAEGWHGKRNGDHKKTGSLKVDSADYLRGPNGIAYGNVVVAASGGERYFLRDEHAWRTATEMKGAPPGVVVLRNSTVSNGTLRARMFRNPASNATDIDVFEDGDPIEFETNWREAPVRLRTMYGGHLVHSAPPNSKTYYVEREHMLWPPHVSPRGWLDMRRRLPPVGSSDAATVVDVLNSELAQLGRSGLETLGPCLSMPRLLFGSNESSADDSTYAPLAPEGFRDGDYVTLRYRHHAAKEAHANKFQKTIIDVSRMAPSNFEGEAENIHIPIKYHCRKDPPRWSASLFRIHHYLDSFEAYSYRNDARAAKRHCREVGRFGIVIVSSRLCKLSYHYFTETSATRRRGGGPRIRRAT